MEPTSKKPLCPEKMLAKIIQESDRPQRAINQRRSNGTVYIRAAVLGVIIHDLMKEQFGQMVFRDVMEMHYWEGMVALRIHNAALHDWCGCDCRLESSDIDQLMVDGFQGTLSEGTRASLNMIRLRRAVATGLGVSRVSLSKRAAQRLVKNMTGRGRFSHEHIMQDVLNIRLAETG